MKNCPFSIALVLLFGLLVQAQTTPASGQSQDRLLTPADIEKVTGWTGIKSIPTLSKPGAGGDLNFVTSEGHLLLMVGFESSENYERSRNMKSHFKATFPGIGEDAYFGPAADPQYILSFRKGKRSFSLTSFFNFAIGGKPYLSIERLSTLARIICSRL